MFSILFNAIGVYKYLLFAALAAMAYWFVWDTGRGFERARWEAAMATEVARQQEIADAFRDSSRLLAEQLLDSTEERGTLLRRLQREARDATDADACGLGAAGVMRLNNLSGSTEAP